VLQVQALSQSNLELGVGACVVANWTALGTREVLGRFGRERRWSRLEKSWKLLRSCF